METDKLRGLIYGKYRTAADMAHTMSWDKQKLHRIMLGKQKPSIDDIFQLAAALDKPWQDVVGVFHDGPQGPRAERPETVEISFKSLQPQRVGQHGQAR